VNIAGAELGYRKQRARAIILTGLIVGCFVAWLACHIPKGVLTNTDELLTAERSREMLLTNPWVVHFNFERSFQKPPLQYWLTSLTLSRFDNRTLAIRIWPAIYGLLTLIVTVWLAFLVDPTRPWLMPLTAAILISCPLFSSETGRGLLDIGLTFYTTIAIVLAQLVRKHPVWWLGVAAACWLGSLQKIPLIFLIWLLIIVIRLSLASESRQKPGSSGWLIISVILAIAATAAWPLLQRIKYHMPIKSVFHEEVTVWLGPEYLGSRPYLEIPFRLTMTAWAFGGLFAFVAPFAVLFWKKQRFSAAAKEIAVLCIALITLAILFNFRSVRYIVPILPSLCLLLAIVLLRFLEQRSAARIGVAVLLALILVAGAIQAETQVYLRQKNATARLENGKLKLDADTRNVADEKRVAKKLEALQEPGTKMVLIKAVKGGGDLLYEPFYMFYANLRFPVTRLSVEQIRQAPPSPPVLGVCVQRDFPAVQEIYPSVKVEFTRAQFILWRVSAE
jgi:4-amino-4-deoxy-L-arabinose transferase-like glycosyltransferase